MLAARQAERDPGALEIVTYEDHHVGHELVDVERLSFRLAIAKQIPKAVNHLPGPSGIAADVAKNLAELDTGSLLEEPASRLGVHRDGRQRLVELVGERGRQLAQGGDPQRMRQLLALPMRLLLRLPPALITLSHGAVGPLARQHAGEDIGQQLQSRDQLGGPLPFAAQAAERQARRLPFPARRGGRR